MYRLDCAALLIALCGPRAPPLMGSKSLFPGNKNPEDAWKMPHQNGKVSLKMHAQDIGAKTAAALASSL